MGLTAEQQRIIDRLREVVPDWRRLPDDLPGAAKRTGFPAKDIRAALIALGRAGGLDRELDRKVTVQAALDAKYCRPARLVCAPVLTAEEIKHGYYMPQSTDGRPFVTLTLPKEYGGTRQRFCAFIVEDDAMEAMHILRGDAAICAIGQLPRDGAPVLCIPPSTGKVCVRCYFRSVISFPALTDPGRDRFETIIPDARHPPVIGPIVSVQRFMVTWRKLNERD